MSKIYTGDWSNNPTSITIPGDGDRIKAASVNPAFEGLMDKMAWTQSESNALSNALRNAMVANWPYRPTIFGVDTLVAFAVQWSAYRKAWVAACKSSNTTVELWQSGDGAEWAKIASIADVPANLAPCSMALDPNSGDVVIGTDPYVSGAQMTIYVLSGGAISVVTLPANRGSIGACAGAYFRGKFLIFGSGRQPVAAGAANSNYVIGTDGGFDALSFSASPFYAQYPVKSWILGQSPTRLVLVGDNQALSPLVYSDDGVTWVAASDALPFISNSDIPISIQWSSRLSKWILLVNSLLTWESRIYTASDNWGWGLSFTSPPGVRFSSLAILDRVWCALGFDEDNQGFMRVFSSLDVATWEKRSGSVDSSYLPTLMGVAGASLYGVVLPGEKSFLLASSIDQRGSQIVDTLP
ncbi:MAG: hypothetical protein FWD73_06875 [Polyangiaceae bacterium]|nr:hypothetical protein [Polyangiaceae bacterium]